MRFQVAALALASLAIAACSPGEPTPEATAPGVQAATVEPSPSASSTENRSKRGNLVKEVGEPALIVFPGQESEPIVNFVVKDIMVDPACPRDIAQPPEIGHFVVLEIEAETGAQPIFEEAFGGQKYQFNPNWWKFVDAKGTTANSTTSQATYACLEEAEYLPMEIGSMERVTGKLVLDIPTTEGTLIFDDPLSGATWEWEVPAK